MNSIIRGTNATIRLTLKVNIIDIIKAADATDVKGVSINGSDPVTPNEDGVVEITISGDGQPAGLRRIT